MSGDKESNEEEVEASDEEFEAEEEEAEADLEEPDEDAVDLEDDDESFEEDDESFEEDDESDDDESDDDESEESDDTAARARKRKADKADDILEQAYGRDKVRMMVLPIDRGAVFRVELDEGALRLMGEMKPGKWHK